jgi:hypothetical protein
MACYFQLFAASFHLILPFGIGAVSCSMSFLDCHEIVMDDGILQRKSLEIMLTVMFLRVYFVLEVLLFFLL